MPRTKLQAKTEKNKKKTKNNSPKAEKERKKRRFRPGTKALMEIKRFQKGKELLVPRLPFHRLCREITKIEDPELRYQPQALQALQEASEAYMVGLFEDSLLCSLHANRMTVMDKDMKLALRIRGDEQKRYR